MINTRKRLETDLEELKKMIFLMGHLSIRALEKSVNALKNQNMADAREVLEADDTIDDLEEKIYNCCMEFAARYQPLGEDLRAVVALMHIAVDLERIGDYGGNIAKVTIEMGEKEPIKPLVDITLMVRKVVDMLNITLDALDTRLPEQAVTVFEMDDEVDGLEKGIVRELFGILLERPQLIEQSFHLMSVSRTLERAGDHVTNIAERIVYMYTGHAARASNFRSGKCADSTSE